MPVRKFVVVAVAAIFLHVCSAKTVSTGNDCSEESWFAALHGADTYTIETCLKEKPDLFSLQDERGFNGIMIATQNSSKAMLDVLLKNKDIVDIDQKTPDGRTALHFAYLVANITIIRTLEQYGASKDIADSSGDTPYDIAKKHGRSILFYFSKFLLTAKLCPIIKDDWQGSELLWAAAHHNFNQVKAALERSGANVEEKDQYGNTALHWAARTGSVKVLKLLLEHGADLAVLSSITTFLTVGRVAENQDGWTAPFFAAFFGHPKILQDLISQGVDLHKKDVFGWSPVIWAAAKGNVDVLSALKQANVSLKDAGAHGITPLMASAAQGKTHAIKYLLLNGAQWRSKNFEGKLAWQFAAEKNRKKALQLLYRILLSAGGRHGIFLSGV
eukprot:gene8208-7756_t